MCKLPEGTRYSFSLLTSFLECPYSVKLQKIDRVEQHNNAFAEYGTLLHSLIESSADGSCPTFALAEEYQRRYDTEVIHPFPPFPRDMGAKYYEEGLAFFENWDGFDDEYDVISIEDEYHFDLDGYPFIGFSDLLLRRKSDSKVKLVDIKSKTTKRMATDLKTYRNQLYLYAMGMKEKYGYYPDIVGFFLPRSNEWVEEDFDPAQLPKTKAWALDVIHKIESEREWTISANGFRCKYICGASDSCPALDAIIADEMARRAAKEDMENGL